MAELTPFATVEDLAAFWRELTPVEKTRANSLLELASNRLRLIARRQNVDLDTKKNDDSVYASVLKWIVCEASKRAIATPSDQPPVNSFQQTAGPYSENYVYTNPSGDLWFKKSELAELGLNGNQTLRSISTSATDIYSDYSEYGS